MNTYYKLARPIIAAHRGLSSIYPENTLEGLKASCQWADFVELDVVLNKNGEAIVCHDVFLSKVSDVAQHPEFADRKKIRELYGKEMNDWWIMDFSQEELETLRINQCILKRKSQYDGQYTFPKLSVTLSSFIELNQLQNTKKGILLEIKDEVFHQQYMKQQIGESILGVLNILGLNNVEKCSNILPLIIMSFDAGLLKFFKLHSELPRALLIEEVEQVKQLVEAQSYADIIGADIHMLWDTKQAKPSPLALNIKELSIPLYGFTFQDDNESLLTLFDCQNINQVYKYSHGFLDGIITEFPQVAVKI